MKPAKPAPKMLVSQIRQDGGTQSRASLHDDVVADYAEAYRTGAIMPPVTLFYDGTDHWLADGFHRVAGATLAKVARIPAEIQQGSKRDAILHSVGANSSHGLRRSNADKRRAVSMLLRDEEWGKKADSWIADACGVSREMVSQHRAERQPSESRRLDKLTRQPLSPSASEDSQEPLSKTPADTTEGPTSGEESGDDEGEDAAVTAGAGRSADYAGAASSPGEPSAPLPSTLLPAPIQTAASYHVKAAQLIAQAQGYLTRIVSEGLPHDPAVMQRLQQATQHAGAAIRQAIPARVCDWCKDPTGDAGRREHCLGCDQTGYLRHEQFGGIPASLLVPGVVHNGSGGVCAAEDWTPPPVVPRVAAAAPRVKAGVPRNRILIEDEAGNEIPFDSSAGE